jgi:hypothetical protein
MLELDASSFYFWRAANFTSCGVDHASKLAQEAASQSAVEIRRSLYPVITMLRRSASKGRQSALAAAQNLYAEQLTVNAAQGVRVPEHRRQMEQLLSQYGNT